MSATPIIDILLASYNGELFIADQITSILNQSSQNWHLIIRDDDSQDGTLNIIRRFRNAHPDKITLIEDGDGNIGVVRNFAKLLNNSRADYIMFCDQDDVWMPNKVEVTLAGMQKAVLQHGHQTPLLIHTDLTVVDQDLRILSPSLWRRQSYNPQLGSRLNRLLVNNVVTGCTVMINRALKEHALPIPAGALMHDWWLVLTASAFGRIHFIEQSTAFYRQHGRNVAGAKWGMKFFLEWLRTFYISGREHKQFLLKTQEQASLFSARYRNRLTDRVSDMLSVYAHLESHSWLAKRWFMFRYGYWGSGCARNVGLLLLM